VAAADAFSYLEAAPDMPGHSFDVVDLAVAKNKGFFRIELPGGGMKEGTREYLIEEFVRSLGRFVEEEASGSPILHAATAIKNGVRGIFMGNRTYGKTTLMLRLLQEGFRIEGDELVLIGTKDVLAVPRRLRVKEGTLPLVPEFAQAITASPSVRTWEGILIYSVNPTIGDGTWRIDRGQADNLFFIEPNHGGSSILTPMPREEAFGHLVTAAVMPASAKAAAAVHLRTMALKAHCWRLQLGDLDRAVWHLQRHFG
jgi:hypothetical protein